MAATSKPVVVVGAGPVGLCLALALAQSEIPVTLIETMSDENFLDQVPRAGSNHPSTLEFFDKIGLYDRMRPRGIVAPKFQYWDRQDGSVIAEFDHIHLKDETKFPFVLQCERIKIVEDALDMAKQHPLISVRMATTFTGFRQGG
ncbi:MAG: FAD-dependent monooxygenase, partial [Xanthobacteraceae bacterium]